MKSARQKYANKARRQWAQITARSLTGKLDRIYVMKCAKYVALYSKSKSDGTNPEADQIADHLLNGTILNIVLSGQIHRVEIHDDDEVEAEEFKNKFNPYI